MKTNERIAQFDVGVLLRRGLLVEYASLGWMTVEALAAIVAGFSSGSLALMAFGGDSFVELLSSYAVARFLRGAVKGGTAESDERVEKITAFLLFALIPIIGAGALYSYFSGIEAEGSPIGIVVASSALVIMPLLWYEKKEIGRAANCLPLTIDAVESATCFLMSMALLASLAINYLWKISWIDYVATAIILAFVTKEGLEAISQLKESESLS